MDWRKAEDFLVDNLRRQGCGPYLGNSGDWMVGAGDDDNYGGTINITALAKDLADVLVKTGA